MLVCERAMIGTAHPQLRTGVAVQFITRIGAKLGGDPKRLYLAGPAARFSFSLIHLTRISYFPS